MEVILIGMLCIVWVQNSCAASKWNMTNLGLVDDSDLSTDIEFLDTDLDYTERTSENFVDDSDLFTDYRFLDMNLDNAELTSNIDDDSDPLIWDMDLVNETGFTEKGCFEIELDIGTKETVTAMANENWNGFAEDISDVGFPAFELTAIIAALFIVLLCLGFLVELVQNQVMDHCNSAEFENFTNPDLKANKIDEYQNTQHYSIPTPINDTDPVNTEMVSDFLVVRGMKVRSQIDDYQNMLEELISKLNYLHGDLAELTTDTDDVQDVIAQVESQINHFLKADAEEDQALMFTAPNEEEVQVNLTDASLEKEELFDPDFNPEFGYNLDALPEVDGLEDPFGEFESYDLSHSLTNLSEEAFGSYSSRASSEESLLEITGATIHTPKELPPTGEEKGDNNSCQPELQHQDFSSLVTIEEQGDKPCQPPSDPSVSCQPELQHRDMSLPVTLEDPGDKPCQAPPAPSCQPKMQLRECPMPPKNRRKVRFYREVRRKTFVVGNPILAFAAPEKKHKIEEFQDTQPLKGDGVGRIPGVLKNNRSFLRSIFRKPSFLKKKEVEKWTI